MPQDDPLPPGAGQPAATVISVRRGTTWDLAEHTIRSRHGTIPFAAIRRIIVCTGAKAYYGLLFFGEAERFTKLSIPIRSRRRPSIEVWQAIRELLASSHQPTLEGYGKPTVSAREFLTEPPLAATRGPRAVAILDAQIAWVAAGGNPRARGAPLELFRVSRYAGP